MELKDRLDIIQSMRELLIADSDLTVLKEEEYTDISEILSIQLKAIKEIK